MKSKVIIFSGVLLTGLALNIVHPSYAKSPTTTVHATLSDAAITARIKALFADSTLIKGEGVMVTTIDKVVILSGIVPTTSQYETAIILADSVDGVEHINVDNFKVKSSETPLSDSFLTAKVKGMFLKEKIFGSKVIEFWPVKVETVNSVVHLTGNVMTKKQKDNLIQLAKNVKGVKAVKSLITIG